MTPAYRKRLLTGSYLGKVALGTQVNTLAVCLVAIARTFGDLSQAQMGLIASLSFVGIVAGLLAAGPLADRYGMRPFIIIGTLLIVVGQAAMALAPAYCLLLAAAVLGGLGAGALDALFSPLVCSICSDARASALNLLHAFYSIGAVATVAGASWMLGWGLSWRLIFPVMTLPALLCGALFAVTPLLDAEAQAAERQRARWLLLQPLFIILLTTMLLLGASELAVAQWVPAYMTRVFGWAQAPAGVVLMGFSIGMAVGRLSASALARRLRPMLLVALAALLCLGCLLVAALAPVAYGSAGAFVIFGLAVSTLWPSILAYTSERFPRGGATMFSLLAGMGNLGGVIGPALVGLIADAAGLRWGMGAVAATSAVLLAVFLWRDLADRRSPSSSTQANPG